MSRKTAVKAGRVDMARGVGKVAPDYYYHHHPLRRCVFTKGLLIFAVRYCSGLRAIQVRRMFEGLTGLHRKHQRTLDGTQALPEGSRHESPILFVTVL